MFNHYQDLLAPLEVRISLTVEASQPEIQELRIESEYKREVQSVIFKTFAEDGSASEPTPRVAEQQLITVEVSCSI